MGSNYRWVPILEGKRLNYHDYFAFTGSCVAFILAFLTFILNLIFRKLASMRKQNKINQRLNGYRYVRNTQVVNDNNLNLEMVSSNHNIYSSQQVIQNHLLNDNQNYNQNIDYQNIPIDMSKDCLQQTAEFFYSATYFFLSISPLIMGGFQVIWTSVSIVMMIGIFALKFILDYYNTDDKPKQNSSIQQNNQGQSTTSNASVIPSKKTLVATILYCTLLPLFFHNTCLSFYNDNIGFYSTLVGFTVNTQFTRIFQLNEVCPPGPPCHFYATLPENTSNDVFINVHTNKQTRNVTVYYDTEEFYLNNTSAKLRNSQPAFIFDLDYVESKGQRNIHSALIQGLQPKTKYAIQIKYDGNDTVQAVHFYKTLPHKDDPNLNITMINAGDAGNTEPARNFNKLVSTLKPDIFFMGGDIAYDDNFNTCYYVWDFYLAELENMFKTLGYLLPMVWTVGNHDVGLNELPLVNITLTNTVGPAYLTYFPQHYERDADFNIIKEVPQIINRRTVFHHEVANFVYLSLDSGYLHDFSGWQEDYIVKTLESNPNTFKFANYHVPVYSACGNVDQDDSTATVRALFHWIPRFDQFRMATVYENHVHTFKRTYPMVGNGVVEKDGTVYLGDGAYGAIPFHCILNSKLKIFAKAAVVNNFWVTQVTQDKLSHRAYNREGDVMDEYEQDAAYYRAI